MTANLIEIVVTAKDLAGPVLDAVEAKGGKLGSAMSKMGAVAATALVGIGIASVGMAAKFDAAITRLNTQAGVAATQLPILKQGVLDLAGQVGFSPDSLAESLFHVESNMASLGITAPRALELVKVAAQGAAVGHANLVDVTNALTSAVASGIPGVQNFTSAMGVLNATVGAGDMTMQDLANAFASGLVPVVKGYGLTILDVGSALATFGDLNIRGAVAATDLRMAVQAMAVPAKAGSTELAKLGMTTDQMAKDMQQGGLLKALEDLKAHMTAAGVTAVQQGQVLTDVFGKKAGVGVTVLYDQLDRLKSKYPDISKAAAGFGNAWATTSQTMQQKLNDLKAGSEALMIELGDRLIPVVKALVDWTLKHKSAVIDILMAMSAFMAMMIAYSVAAKTAAIATTLWAVAMGELDVAEAANPVGLIAIAVVAVGIAIFELVKHWRQVWGDIKHWAEDAWRFIYDGFGKYLLPMLGPVGWIALGAIELARHWKEIWDGIKAVAEDLKHWLWDDFGAKIVDFFTRTLVPPVERAFHDLMGVVDAVMHAVGAAVSYVWDSVLQPIFNLIVAVVRFDVAVAMLVLRDVVVPAWHAIADVVKWAWQNVIKPQFDAIVQGAHYLGDAAMWLWHNQVEPAWRGFAAVVQWAWNSVIKPAWSALKEQIGQLGDAGMWLWHNVVEPAWHGIGAAIQWVWQNMIKPVFDAFEATINRVTDLFNTLTAAINGNTAGGSLGGDIGNTLTNLANARPGGGVHAAGGHHLGMAAGGVVGAAAWGGVQGGWTRMNEEGIELVRLPTGSTVMPHANTMGALAGGAGPGPAHVILELVGRDDDPLFQMIRKGVRVRGGNVQVVLGHG